MESSFIGHCVHRLAWQAMRQLHPEAIAAIQSKALFSQNEEALLAKIGSVSNSFIFTVLLLFYCLNNLKLRIDYNIIKISN